MEIFENYKKAEITVGVVKANIYSLLLLIPFIAFYGIPFYVIWQESLTFENLLIFARTILPFHPIVLMLLIIVVMVVGIVAHELIHGLFWGACAKNGFKSIKFGVKWEMLTPYCHCSEPLLVKQYILGAIMPFIILGFIPAILGIIFGNILLLFFGFLFSVSASGDFIIVFLMRRERANDFVQDHPTEVGCFVYRKNG